MKRMANQLRQVSAQVIEVHEFISGVLNHSFRLSSKSTAEDSVLLPAAKWVSAFSLGFRGNKIISIDSWSLGPPPCFRLALNVFPDFGLVRVGGLKPHHHCRGTWKQQGIQLPNRHKLNIAENMMVDFKKPKKWIHYVS